MPSRHDRLFVVLVSIAMAAVLRLLPHPPNFTPVGAMALFSGAHLGRRPLAFAAPLGAMLLSDLALGFYSGVGFVYASVALIVVVGSLSLSRISALRLGVSAATSSLLFFVVSNFGTWLQSGIYPHNLNGFIACYVAAIPFFGNTLVGDAFYLAIFFAAFSFAEWLMLRIATRKAQIV